MFEYLCNERSFKQKLGNYISHKIISYYDKEKGRIFRTPEELNKMDRMKLAIEFYESDDCYIEGGIDSSYMKDDIAEYIDYMIPKAYAKWYLKEHDKSPSQMNIDAEIFGLAYKYECNKKK